jgi:4-methyl-5(b-hydroxyethyl)-thiazole monophosphate biosynthesis
MEEDFDMIVLPGGLPGADHLDQDVRIHALLTAMSESGRFTAAICAAPKVLANAGLLDGKSATSYPGIIDAMELENTKVLQDPVVVDGKIVTSRGPGTAMDFALALIELLLGPDKRREVETPLVRPA